MSDLKNYYDNPNPDAKIAFVIWGPFDFYFVKNIVRHLPEAEFVVCAISFDPDSISQDAQIRESIALIRKMGFRWRVFPLEYLSAPDYLDRCERFFESYEMVVAPRLWSPLTQKAYPYWTIKKKSVLISYGVGKDLITVAPWSALFDIILVQGERMEGQLKNLSNPVITGESKHDDWFSGTVDAESIREIRSKINPSKKTVLYLPTNGTLSSLPFFGDAVLSLADTYNVLIKTHYLNNIFNEQHILKRLIQKKNVTIFGSDSDILPLFKVADVVLSDHSSALFETLLVDKPLVVLDVPGQQHIDANFLTTAHNGVWSDVTTYYKKSIDQEIKLLGNRIGEVVADPGMLAGAVAKGLANPSLYNENRERYKKTLFSYNDGHCGKRAANVIKDFLTDKIKPEPPLIGEAIRANFLARTKRAMRENAAATEKVARLMDQTSTLQKQVDSFQKLSIIRNERSFFKKVMMIMEYALNKGPVQK